MYLLFECEIEHFFLPDSDELKEMKFMEIDPNSAAAAGSSGVQPEPEKTKLKKSRREESEFLKKEFNLHSESSTSSQEDDDDYNPSGKKRKTHVSRSKRSKKLPNKEVAYRSHCESL